MADPLRYCQGCTRPEDGRPGLGGPGYCSISRKDNELVDLFEIPNPRPETLFAGAKTLLMCFTCGEEFRQLLAANPEEACDVRVVLEPAPGGTPVPVDTDPAGPARVFAGFGVTVVLQGFA